MTCGAFKVGKHRKVLLIYIMIGENVHFFKCTSVL